MDASVSTSRWIAQADYPQGGPCVPIAMCNALIYWGFDPPRPGDDLWEVMVDVAKCRYGSAIQPSHVAAWLDLVQVPVHFEHEQMPLMLSVHDPKWGMHAVLMTERDGDKVRLHNYEGKPDQWVLVSDLELVSQGKVSMHQIAWLVPTFMKFKAKAVGLG